MDEHSGQVPDGNAPRPDAQPEQEQAPDTLATIGDVVELLQPHYPDISISSLRFLEREGLIAPQRTRGGHRLFSRQDIERVRSIKELQRRRYSLAEIALRLAAREPTDRHEPPADRFLALTLAGRRAEALQLVEHAVASGLTVEDLYQTIITPAMTQLGDLWQQGKVSVADEHLATAISRDALAILKQQIASVPLHGLRAVAAGAPGELHELGLKMTADLFEGAGWEVDYLGPNTPVDSLLAYLARRKPHLLLLSIGSVATLLATAELITAVRAREHVLGRIVVGVGGAGLSDNAQAWQHIGADFYARDPRHAVSQAAALVAREED